MEKVIHVQEGSFKESTQEISIDKDITLFWGYNGSGKTSISKAIANANTLEYKTLVYNEDFVEKYFKKEEEETPGIFTMGDTNVGVEKKLKELQTEKTTKESERDALKQRVDDIKEKLDSANNVFKEKAWKIRGNNDINPNGLLTKGYNKNKEDFAKKVKEHQSKLTKTLEEIKEGARFLSSDISQEKLLISIFDNVQEDGFAKLKKIVDNELLSKVIVGTQDSSLSDLIGELENSHWVKEGEKYISESRGLCPFCQQGLPKDFSDQIRTYFDKTYEEKKGKLGEFKSNYEKQREQLIKDLEEVRNNDAYKEYNEEIARLGEQIGHMETTLNKNIGDIKEKVEKPNKQVTLLSIDEHEKKIKAIIEEINTKIEKYNTRVKALDKEKSDLADAFFRYCADECRYEFEEEEKKGKELRKQEEFIKESNKSLNAINSKITELRGKLTGIARSIKSVNKLLRDNGFTNFFLEEAEADKKYKIVRTNGENTDVFRSLSEGEKQLITFFYFITLCDGSLEEQDKPKYEIIAIDDPVSSLSFTSVYAIAHLIQDKFFKKESDTSTPTHFVLLTHNIYFLQRLKRDLLDNRSGDYKSNYSAEMKRVRKEEHKSEVVLMKPKEIQSEYEMLWLIVRDAKDKTSIPEHPCLANAMRQILEHFFDLVNKTELKNIKSILPPFRAFINAGSHAKDVQDNGDVNIDHRMKEFKNIFLDEGFQEHYNLMMRTS